MPRAVASIHREHVEVFLVWMTESYKPASVRSRYTGVRQFFAWLLEEGEITETPIKNIPPPAIPENPPPILTEAQVRSLLSFVCPCAKDPCAKVAGRREEPGCIAQ
jgi:site-specific recombinase XerD